ncbi:hypothetical protein LCGC14_0757750 [marine sediment metagenome]|uniref:Uncharacterized protein n=1 Tax=marine sediment metagenome TaxID=412755 RepID=A0A0F9Q254_9ZZZZ
MERITGTLKYFGPTKEGDKATLTGDWSNGKDKVWVTWAEAKPLRQARTVYKSSEKWDDGKPKWKVDGKPNITLEVTGDGKNSTTKVLTNGAEPDKETPDTAPTGRSTLDTLAKHFAYCLAKAEKIWADTGNADVMYKTAYTLYRDTNSNDHPEDSSAKQEDDDDLPFG